MLCPKFVGFYECNLLVFILSYFQECCILVFILPLQECAVPWCPFYNPVLQHPKGAAGGSAQILRSSSYQECCFLVFILPLQECAVPWCLFYHPVHQHPKGVAGGSAQILRSSSYQECCILVFILPLQEFAVSWCPFYSPVHQYPKGVAGGSAQICSSFKSTVSWCFSSKLVQQHPHAKSAVPDWMLCSNLKKLPDCCCVRLVYPWFVSLSCSSSFLDSKFVQDQLLCGWPFCGWL